MAYLTFTASEENKSTCFMFIGLDAKPTHTQLISNSTSLISPSVGGEDTCSFYSGPSDATIMAFGESCESTGSLAYSDSASGCSVAYSGGGESCGSIASSVSSGSSMGGSCSYSC